MIFNWSKALQIPLLVWPVILVLSSCNPSGNKQDGNPDDTNEKGINWEKLRKNAESDPRKKIDFDEYYLKFSVRVMDQLKFVPRDSLHWAAGILQSPQTGNVAHFFFRDEERMTLEAPHVRVDWIYARMPNCSTSDSLFWWLESQFVGGARQGKIILERRKFGTYSGKPAWIEAVYVPEFRDTDTTIKSAKWMAWAYIQDDDYWVGWVFTAHSQPHWEKGIPVFEKLVGTYEEDKWYGPS